ncbi:MAG: hypothetical protein LBL74_07530 [Bacteroidales bacterium]|nr:hypothetical protein [Bacteroidales bacterium]
MATTISAMLNAFCLHTPTKGCFVRMKGCFILTKGCFRKMKQPFICTKEPKGVAIFDIITKNCIFADLKQNK